MQTLFESHPKLKNSLNTMSREQRSKVDFDTWEVNAEGYINSVTTLMPEYEFEDKLLWADSERANKDIAQSGMLPLEVQDWLNEHTTGLWFYATYMNMDKKDKMYFKNIMFVFNFEKEKDAAIFRLTWQK